MARVHATAIVDPRAELDADVEIGPYTVIDGPVRIGAGTRVGAHVVLSGHTTIGRNNRIFPFAALGSEPQDKKYAGEDTLLEIGDDNTIREYCLFNPGTVQGGGVTRVGSGNWIMGYVHLAHDCRVGDHTILANVVQLAGHVTVGDWAILGGTAVAHQFVRIGAHAMCGGASVLHQDVPPYTMCNGQPAAPHGINSEGLKRRHFSDEQIAALRRAYKVLYRDGLTLAEARQAIEQIVVETPGAAAAVRVLADFLADAGRGIIR